MWVVEESVEKRDNYFVGFSSPQFCGKKRLVSQEVIHIKRQGFPRVYEKKDVINGPTTTTNLNIYIALY